MKYEIDAKDNRVNQPASSIPITRKTQVLVAGGGTAGFVAAIAAARNGAETMLLERNSCVGGMATAGMLDTFVHANLPSGIFSEILQKLEARGGVEPGAFIISYDSEQLKPLLLEMLEETGVHLLLNTWVSDAIVRNGTVEGVVVESKSGRQAVIADVTVDCTGDGDVAARAGAGLEQGRKKDGMTQKASLLFRVGNVDTLRLLRAIREEPDQFQGGKTRVDRLLKDVFNALGFFDKVSIAKERGELDPSVDLLNIKFVPGCVERRMLTITASKLGGINPVSAEDMTRARIMGHRQVAMLLRFLRKDIPGFEDSFLMDTADQIGVRDSRRIIGEDTLTEEDVLDGTVSEDSVALNVSSGPPIKGWSRYDKENPELYSTQRGEKTWPITVNGIPYRCLLPRDLDRLLVAGRCFSATWEAQGRSRSMPTCMGMGQAAGTAAAMAVKDGVSPKALNVGELRQRLQTQGLMVMVEP